MAKILVSLSTVSLSQPSKGQKLVAEVAADIGKLGITKSMGGANTKKLAEGLYLILASIIDEKFNMTVAEYQKEKGLRMGKMLHSAITHLSPEVQKKVKSILSVNRVTKVAELMSELAGVSADHYSGAKP